MFKKHNLFSSPVCVTTIDPTSYKKDEFIKIIEGNYEKDPHRNKWDTHSDMHHNYGDMNNPLFEKYDFEDMFKSLHDQYNNIVEEYITQMHFNKSVVFRWVIANVTGMKKTQYMLPHTHMKFDGDKTTILSAVHYLRYKEGHLPTTFETPLSVMYDGAIYEKYREVLENSHLENSNYYRHSSLNAKEDEFHIFPSYLKHYVPPQKSDELRITVVINVEIWEAK